MYWLRWHYHVKDIAGAPYKIKQNKQKQSKNDRSAEKRQKRRTTTKNDVMAIPCLENFHGTDSDGLRQTDGRRSLVNRWAQQTSPAAALATTSLPAAASAAQMSIGLHYGRRVGRKLEIQLIGLGCSPMPAPLPLVVVHAASRNSGLREWITN